MTFVHLNVHSKASMLYGSADINELVSKAKELGQPAIALTDYSNVFNAIKFYTACKDAGVKPILGVDVLFCDDVSESKSHKIRQAYHLTLLAENEAGWRNIARIVSEAQDPDHFYYRARVDFDTLEKYNEGVICLSGSSLDGAVSYYLYDKLDNEGFVREAAGRFRAEAMVRRFVALYGTENFFLETQDTGHESQPIINERLRGIATKYGLQTVATGNVHYVKQSDAEAHKTLLAMDKNKYNKASGSVFDEEEFYLKSEEELLETDLTQEELDAAATIAERCNVDIDVKKRRLPKYKFIPDGKTAMEYLRELSAEGMVTLGFDPSEGDGHETYQERLDRELSDIDDMGFADYFLIVHDVISWVRSKNIILGPGRGSAGGSLVSCVLGITEIDPLKYGLIWERFLNKGRGGLPDIDTDVPRSKRQAVLTYVRERFGTGNVAQLVTFNGLQARAVLKDVFHVFDMPFDEANRITALVPTKGEDHTQITLAAAIEKVPELQEYEKKYGPWFKIARALEGCYKSTGLHAAAVVISDEPFEDSAYPLTRSRDGSMIFGWDMGTVDSLSLLKLDILGLTTLDDIQVTRELVEKRHGITLTRKSMPLDDLKTYYMLGQGFTTGIFQIEKQLGRTWSKNLEPKTILELSDLVSLIRPGPMESGMHNQYRSVKMKGEEPGYIHDMLIPILKNTYSGLLYQEQVIEICKQIAGMSLIDSDKVRKAMGKKKPEEMRKWKNMFVKGAMKSGVDKETAGDIWNYIEVFAGYGFNKSHGVGYALLAYETAYLKANYTTEFLCAKLRHSEGDYDKLSALVYDAKLFDVEVTPPRVSAGNKDFDITDDRSIAFGLSALKGVGRTAVDDLVRHSKKCGTVDDVLWLLATNKTKVNSAVITALIRGGAFDNWQEHRIRSMARYRLIDGLTPLEVEAINTLREELPEIVDWTRFMRSLSDETKAPQIKEKYGVKIPNVRRRERIRDLLQDYEAEEIFDNKAQRIAWEKHYLGISLSGSESDIYKSQHKCVDLIKSGETDMAFEIAVCIDSVKEILTKKGDPMAFLTVHDDTYAMDNVVVFPRQFEKAKRLLESGNVIRIRGKQDDGGSLLANTITRLT